MAGIFFNVSLLLLLASLLILFNPFNNIRYREVIYVFSVLFILEFLIY
jgi:hypothetical protein